MFKRLNCIKSNPHSIFSSIFFKKSLKCEPICHDLSIQYGHSQNISTMTNIYAPLIFNYIYNSYNLLDFKDLPEIYKDQNSSVDIENNSIKEDLNFIYNPLIQTPNSRNIGEYWKRNSFPLNKHSMLVSQNFSFNNAIHYKKDSKKNLIFQNIQNIYENDKKLFYYNDGKLILMSIQDISKKTGLENHIKVCSQKDDIISETYENEKTDNIEFDHTTVSCQVIVKAGSLERLVDVLVLGLDDFSERLVNHSKNIQFNLYMNIEEFRLIFMSTFRSFCTPSVLLEYFTKRLAGSKAVASRIDPNIKVSEHVKNDQMFPDWNLLETDDNNLFNYDFYLKIHVGVLECMILWLTHYFDDFIDDLDVFNGFYSFLQSANNQMQNWKKIVSIKSELQYHMSKYLNLFEKVKSLFVKSSYRPQIKISEIGSLKILQEINVSTDYNDDEIFDLACTLDKLVTNVFETLTMEDWIYCSELLETQSVDMNSFFVYQQPISLKNDDYIMQDIYSLLSQIQRINSDLLINIFPNSIRELFRLRQGIIEWVISQITDINIDYNTRVHRILLYLRLLSIYKLTMTHLNFYSEFFNGDNLIKNKSFIPSFIGNAISAALVRPESRLFIYAWSTVASRQGLNGQVKDLASVIPFITVKKSFLFTPCIGWIFEHLLKIIFYIPNTVVNHQLINFVKKISIYNFILHIINLGNHKNSGKDQLKKNHNDANSLINFQVHDIRTLEMVSENENYPIQFSNIEKPFQVLIQKKILMIQENQEHYENIKKYFKKTEESIEKKNIDTKQNHKGIHKKITSKYRYTNFFHLTQPDCPVFANDSNSDKNLNLSNAFPGSSSNFPIALESEPSDVIDLIDSSVSSLEISRCEYIFKIKLKNKEKILLRAPTIDEYRIWYQKLKNLTMITFNKKKNVLTKNVPIESTNTTIKKSSIDMNPTACYGVDLATLCSREKNIIPKIVNDLIIEVESRGLKEVGIYRVPGSLVRVNALKALFDSGKDVNLKDDCWADINIITGALKLWLRELPEPLMTYKLYPKFIDLVDISDCHKKIASLRTLIQNLPVYNYFLIKRLIEHFEKVINHEAINQMYAHNLAIIFGPNFLQPFPSNYSYSQTVKHLEKAQEVIKELIIHRDSIFKDQHKPI